MSESSNINDGNSHIYWKEGTPVASRFDDVYYSVENGMEESRFVFLHGCGMPDTWQDRDIYTIAETGFGTGLNFLTTVDAFLPSGEGHLHFLTTEAFLLPLGTLQKAHQAFPALSHLMGELYAAWPPDIPGIHIRTLYGGRVTLQILVGLAHDTLPMISGHVDAWYLDGFAPAKNPEMWSDMLLDQIARLSKPGTTFATFTAAGFVRRGLTERGFSVRKSPGYGRKRERLTGIHEGADTSVTAVHTSAPIDTSRKEWAWTPAKQEGTIAVIGGGIAGSWLAYALRRFGRDVTLFDGHTTTSAAGLKHAILAPGLVRERGLRAQFIESAYQFVTHNALIREHMLDAEGLFIRAQSQQDISRHKELVAATAWPDDEMTVTEDGDLHCKNAGTIDCLPLLGHLQQRIKLIPEMVTSMQNQANSWVLKTAKEKILGSFNTVIIAAGAHTPPLMHKNMIGMNMPGTGYNLGQVDFIDGATGPTGTFSFGGYLTSADTDGLRSLGSTFDKITGDLPATVSPDDASSHAIAEKARNADVLHKTPSIHSSWSGVRLTVPDHLPYCGPVVDKDRFDVQFAKLSTDAKISGLGQPPVIGGLYMLTGFGSKGYQYAPFLAEHLASILCKRPSPLPVPLQPLVHPARDFVRRLVKNTK